MIQQPFVSTDPTDWQVAPTESQLANYDTQQIFYRKAVEKFIQPLSRKSIRKKAFFTICTNVLCADEASSRDDSVPSAIRDIYQPLEIAITKWTFANPQDSSGRRVVDTKVWMINPGQPYVNRTALDHKAQDNKHKIDFDPQDKENEYVENDWNKIIKEINSFLTADRLVFSTELKMIKQDLGSLKWLNRETGGKMKPIKVYNLEDLYVVVIRHLKPDSNGICQGIAHYNMQCGINAYDINLQCKYHLTKSYTEDGDTRFCAKGISEACTQVVLEEVVMLADLQEVPQSTSSSRSIQPVENQPDVSDSIHLQMNKLNITDK